MHHSTPAGRHSDKAQQVLLLTSQWLGSRAFYYHFPHSPLQQPSAGIAPLCSSELWLRNEMDACTMAQSCSAPTLVLLLALLLQADNSWKNGSWDTSDAVRWADVPACMCAGVVTPMWGTSLLPTLSCLGVWPNLFLPNFFLPAFPSLAHPAGAAALAPPWPSSMQAQLHPRCGRANAGGVGTAQVQCRPGLQAVPAGTGAAHSWRLEPLPLLHLWRPGHVGAA